MNSQATALQNQILSDNSTIDSLNSQKAELENQLALTNSLIASDNAAIAYLQSQVTTLQNQVENLQNQIVELLNGGEQMKLGSPYGWVNNGTTVYLVASCPSGNAFTISTVRINGTAYTPTGSLGPIAPQSSTILTVTLTGGNKFLSGYSYTIVVVTTKNNECQTTGTVP